MDKKFTWVPFYIELADKIRDFKDDRATLILKVKEAHISANKELPKIETDNDNIPDIDPFTVFALFNRGKQSVDARKAICTGYKDAFDIATDVPSDFDGIPMFNYNQYCFYRYVNDPKRDNNCFGILWELFEESIKRSQGENNEVKFEKCFEKALKLSLVGVSKLTIGLFQVRPNTFINLDSVNKPLIESKLKKTVSIQSGSDYLNLCKEVSDFIQASNECKTLPEFSSLAYDKKAQDKATPINDWFPTKEDMILRFQKNNGLIL